MTTFTIYLGDQKTMYLRAVNETYYGIPLDLSSCDEIDIALPNADGTFAHRLLSEAEVSITSPAILGQFSTSIPSAVSALLNPGLGQSIEVTFTIGAQIFTVGYFGALNVREASAYEAE